MGNQTVIMCALLRKNIVLHQHNGTSNHPHTHTHMVKSLDFYTFERGGRLVRV